jgi:hypothetical protein
MHFAFSVTPSFERLTNKIACKDALYERKMEEWRMRSGAGTPSRSMRQTADRYMHLHPPEIAFSSPPVMPSKVKKVVTAPQRGVGSGVSGSVSSSSGQLASGRTPSTAPKSATKASISRKQQETEHRREVDDDEAMKQQIRLNVRWFSKRGLPSVYNMLEREMLMQCPRPHWVQRANKMWKMQARIIDFWGGGAQRDAQMFRYLEFLGFEVALDQSATQIGLACGMIAAQNVVKLQFSSSHLFDVNVSSSADWEWYQKGMDKLGIKVPRNTTETEVQHLATAWFLEELEVRLSFLQFQAETNGDELPTQLAFEEEEKDFVTSISSFDLTLREICADVKYMAKFDRSEQLFARRRPINPRKPGLRMRIANTLDMDSIGAHWFTIAYSFTPRVEWEADDEHIFGDDTDEGGENVEDENAEEVESLEVEDPSYDEVQRMVNGVALDLCMKTSERCCSLENIYSELCKTHAWFRQCTSHGFARKLMMTHVTRSNNFMVSDGIVHII